MVVRDVVLLVVIDGAIWFTLQQGLVEPVSQPSESTVDSSPSNECNFDSSLDWRRSDEFSQEREFFAPPEKSPISFLWWVGIGVEHAPTVWSPACAAGSRQHPRLSTPLSQPRLLCCGVE